jgi:predicted RNase H-like nuclease (RuvC/YqgF family)
MESLFILQKVVVQVRTWVKSLVWLSLIIMLVIVDQFISAYRLDWFVIMRTAFILYIILAILIASILWLIEEGEDEVDQLRSEVKALTERDDARQKELEALRSAVKSLQDWNSPLKDTAAVLHSLERKLASFEKRLWLHSQTLGFPANFAQKRQLPKSKLDVHEEEVQRLEMMILLLARLCRKELVLSEKMGEVFEAIFDGDNAQRMVMELVKRNLPPTR